MKEISHYKSDFLMWVRDRSLVNNFYHIGVSLVFEWRIAFLVQVSFLTEWRYVSEWDLVSNDTHTWTENHVAKETRTGRRALGIRVGKVHFCIPLRRAK